MRARRHDDRPAQPDARRARRGHRRAGRRDPARRAAAARARCVDRPVAGRGRGAALAAAGRGDSRAKHRSRLQRPRHVPGPPAAHGLVPPGAAERRRTPDHPRRLLCARRGRQGGVRKRALARRARRHRLRPLLPPRLRSLGDRRGNLDHRRAPGDAPGAPARRTPAPGKARDHRLLRRRPCRRRSGRPLRSAGRGADSARRLACPLSGDRDERPRRPCRIPAQPARPQCDGRGRARCTRRAQHQADAPPASSSMPRTIRSSRSPTP